MLGLTALGAFAIGQVGYSDRLIAQSGSFVVTGSDAVLAVYLAGQSGSYILTGNAATLTAHIVNPWLARAAPTTVWTNEDVPPSDIIE